METELHPKDCLCSGRGYVSCIKPGSLPLEEIVSPCPGLPAGPGPDALKWWDDEPKDRHTRTEALSERYLRADGRER